MHIVLENVSALLVQMAVVVLEQKVEVVAVSIVHVVVVSYAIEVLN